MKRSHLHVAILCVILAVNVVLTQLVVHQYFFQNYAAVLIYGGFNLLLFPVAVFVYKHDRRQRGVNTHE
ncbi:hypothetical protein [Bacillus thermotolerans]|uniref:Uncharacterized protein n=1 Tax=Bacillus thermotolerans TaxID=1221996 RepID=A0A0F5HM23_BACTR|nr:hypothetical protein [Bacillus thermotolerans]KKB34341.1 hypothetical protein QY95_03952 [Bacillus thermotolerans]